MPTHQLIGVTKAFEALSLVVTANFAPWAAGRLLPGRWRVPIDGGATLSDGTRLLGDHKTWLGLAAGLSACGALAGLLGRPVRLGLAFGGLSLAADAMTSLIKRRLRARPGTEIPLLDQLPEAFVPLAILSRPLGLKLVSGLTIAVVFSVLDLAVMRLRHPRAPLQQ